MSSKAHIIRALAPVAVVVLTAVATLAFVSAAQATIFPDHTYTQGSPGYWLSPDDRDNVTCNQGDTMISHATLLISRSPAAGYANHVQRIEMWPRVDVYDFSINAWRFLRYGLRVERNVAPYNPATFGGYSGDPALANLGRGYFRIGYFFRWSVNGQMIGEALTYNGVDDYWHTRGGYRYPWCDFSR